MSKCRTVIGLRGDDADVNRSARLALTFGVAFVVALPLGFIFAPDPTGVAPLFLTAGLAAVFGLPVYFGLSRASGSES
ncbi:hypothetical protein C458_14206 [Haloferax sp. ATCC BAA-644]|nr:hypothetical protein C460_12092 [Haloferax sp. ATCC BAA-646]ELZ62523.1 hypothetical protein C459_13469 [Haloferax sp. ATCC BAA-645]ELZ65005.1 hypothetical protein C458_14206 [Haloferax sp. ATCC BAA-644]